MSVENDIRTFLIAQLTGEPTITVQGLPATPDDAIGIVVRGGPSPVLTMGFNVVMQETFIEVTVRGAIGQSQKTEALLQDVHAVLRAAKDVMINSTTYDLIQTQSVPRKVEEDRNGRPLWMSSYRVTLVE